MQLSIYLDGQLVRRVDRMARKMRRSRSSVIAGLLTEALRNEGRPARADRLEALAGSWSDRRSADDIARDIYLARTPPTRRTDLA